MSALVRFVGAPGMGEIIQAVNRHSSQQWAAMASASPEATPCSSTGPPGDLSPSSNGPKALLERWHVTVLPTLAALRLVGTGLSKDTRRGCSCLPLPGSARRSAAADNLADWATDFLARNPAPMPRSRFASKPPSSTVEAEPEERLRFHSFTSEDLADLDFEFPPIGAEDECSEFSDTDEGADLLARPELDFQPATVKTVSRPNFLECRSERSNDGIPDGLVAPWESEYQRGSPEHGWDHGNAKDFSVRGAKYLADGVKVPSAPEIFEVVSVDLCQVQNPDGIKHVSLAPGGAVQALRRAGDMRFFFVVNWRFPPTQLCCVFAAPTGTVWPPTATGDPQTELFKRFINEMSDQERNESFKIVPWVKEGPWLVKTALGKSPTPTVIGKKLTIDYYHVPGDHFEVSVDIYSSMAARNILGLVQGAAKKLIIEMSLVIEGKTPEDLPERVLASFKVLHGDLSRLRGPIDC